MREFVAMAVAVAAALAGACQTVPASQPVALAITNVTVIDPESRRVLPGRSVFIDGDRIVAVSPASARSRYSAARSVDGTGRFLILGLMDMHLHLFLPKPAAPTMNLLLANGVTGGREMSGDCWAVAGAKEGCIADYRALQAQVKSGELAGPELLSFASTMVMGPAQVKLPANLEPFIVPENPGKARELVRYLKGRGVDLIKTHDSMPMEVFTALSDEARKAGLETGGHIPFGAGVLGAVGLGYRSIEHARDLLYDCSGYGPQFRRAGSDYADRKTGAAKPQNLERMKRTVEEFDAAKCRTMLHALARTPAFYTPTHVTREMEARADDPAYRSDATRKYILRARDRNWEKDLAETAGLPAAERSQLRSFFEHGLKITGLAHKAGVRIMTGTDANDTMIVPGFSLHGELALLARAGMPPMEVLRASTTIPALYLKRADLGGIAAGKEADLVLLGRNPLDDIGNSRSIESVISNGRFYDRAALDALLAAVEQMARKP
jgi:imidazolonepropionase-like amidohydrolase